MAAVSAGLADRMHRGTIVKVIGRSLRKGNIIEVDGELFVVLNAENFHPGKGTPTTQVDMRRIRDGVKTAQRYKTTDQVERAHVEDREFQFLYNDGDGFHFMNSETYDQISLPADMIGDQAAYLQPEMKVSCCRTACAPWCRRISPPALASW
jgi:elongation factor P